MALDKLRRAITGVMPSGQAESVIEAAAWTIGLALPARRDLVGRCARTPVRSLDALRRRLGRDHRPCSRSRTSTGPRAAPRPAGAAGGLPRRDERADRVPGAAGAAGVRPGWGAGKQNAIALKLAPLTAGDARRAGPALLGESQRASGRSASGSWRRRGQSVLPRGDAEDADRGGSDRATERWLESPPSAR